MSPVASTTNGVLSPPQSARGSGGATQPGSPRIVLAGNSARVLCVADIRGDYHELNRLIREHEATSVIHTGDFGFLNADSLERMGDKILRHLLQYSPLIPPATRNQLLSIPASAGRSALINQLNSSSIHFPLSQFPHLLSGAITFPVPVFTVWGLIEDVRILEKFRTGEYEVSNLTVIDEASSALIETAGIKLRLLGLGGAVVLHKMFDNGEGFATIAGGQGTMWTTALQMGELVDTAQRVFDPTETRVLVTTAPVSRTGLLSLLSHAVKADLTISGGLHFRYPASLNDFAVNGDFESYRQKLVQARDSFTGVYEVVKDRVEGSLNEQQQMMLKKVLGMVQKIPSNDDNAWTNTWHWVLADALCGHLLLSITDGRVSAETRSHGLNFAHRANHIQPPPTAPLHSATAAPLSQTPRSSAADAAKQTPSTIPPKPPAPTTGPPKTLGSPASAKMPITSVPPKPTASTQPPAPREPRAARGDSPTVMSPVKMENKKDRDSPAQATAKPVTTPTTNSGIVNANNINSSAKATPSGSPAVPPKEPKKGPTNGDHKPEAEEMAESPKTGPQTPKRFSLYLKGLPNPTTETEVKAFFGSEAEKITTVKLVYDPMKRQKNFCYVDFANEQDLQDTLKLHPSGTIRESPITVEPSNPPIRNLNPDRGGRGGRTARGGGRMARGGSASSKDALPKPEN